MDELSQLIAKPESALQTAQAVAGLSGSEDGASMIRGCKVLVDQMLKICAVSKDDSKDGVLHHILVCLVNLTAEDNFCEKLISDSNVVDACVQLLLNHAGAPIEEGASMLLANLTRLESGAIKLATTSVKNGVVRLVNRLAGVAKSEDAYDERRIDHVVMALGNMTQTEQGRLAMLTPISPSAGLLCHNLLHYNGTLSDTWVLGVLSVIKNCAFDEQGHDLLLPTSDSDADDALALFLVAPLIGGGRPLSDDDKKGMPVRLLQMMEQQEQLKANENVVTRKTTLEALLQLCKTRTGRDYFRKQKVYCVLRERHLLEEDSECIELIEWVVDMTVLKDEV